MLSALIHPHTNDEFLIESWQREPFVTHALAASVKELTELPFLQSLDSLLAAWPFQVQAHLPDAADECSSIDVSTADAKKLFSNKLALLFNNAERISPLLQQWLLSLRKDLGLPTSTYGRCLLYATPHGKGTAAHFDQNVNFVLQIHGVKKWYLAPNTSIQNPTQRFTIGQPMDPELAAYADQGEMPVSMPQLGRQEIVLKPGSMLYVPRGYWHSTEAEGEALALNFTFNQPTWIDLFTIALRSRLSLSPYWRELADGVTAGDQDRRELANEKFDILLRELIEDLPSWRAADILGATEGELSD